MVAVGRHVAVDPKPAHQVNETAAEEPKDEHARPEARGRLHVGEHIEHEKPEEPAELHQNVPEIDHDDAQPRDDRLKR